MDLRTPLILADVAEDKPVEWPHTLRKAYERAYGSDPSLPPPPPGGEVDTPVAAVLRRKFPRFDDPALRPVQLAEAYSRLIALSVARLEFLGQLIAEEFDRLEERPGAGRPVVLGADDADDPEFGGERDLGQRESYDPGAGGGIRALVGETYELTRYGGAVATGEKARALFELEAKERDRAAALIKDAVRLGIQAKQVDVMRSYGHTVVAALKNLAEQLGHDWGDRGTREAARWAITSARSQVGVSVTEGGG